MKLTESEIKCLIFELNITQEQISNYIENIKWYNNQVPKKAGDKK
jgi:hypothetical protein